MKKSKFLKLNWFDFTKSFIVAFIAAFLQALLVILNEHAIPTLLQLKTSFVIGVTSGFAYIIKNWLTNNADQFMKKDT